MKKRSSKKFIKFQKEHYVSKYNRGLTKEEIEKISEEVVGKTFGELRDFKYNLDDFNYKGGMGVLMEENVFQYEANSDANPDFYEAKIELKVTPVKRNKNGTYSAKERLVLNIINYIINNVLVSINNNISIYFWYSCCVYYNI